MSAVKRLCTINCIPDLTAENDRAFWVSRDIFEREFDQRNFYCRDSQEIDANYSKHLFYEDSQGKLQFRVPTVQVLSGATQFINGRHRVAVLFRQIDRIPVAFAAGQAQNIARKLELEQVFMGKPIELPD